MSILFKAFVFSMCSFYLVEIKAADISDFSKEDREHLTSRITIIKEKLETILTDKLEKFNKKEMENSYIIYNSKFNYDQVRALLLKLENKILKEIKQDDSFFHPSIFNVFLDKHCRIFDNFGVDKTLTDELLTSNLIKKVLKDWEDIFFKPKLKEFSENIIKDEKEVGCVPTGLSFSIAKSELKSKIKELFEYKIIGQYRKMLQDSIEHHYVFLSKQFINPLILKIDEQESQLFKIEDQLRKSKESYKDQLHKIEEGYKDQLRQVEEGCKDQLRQVEENYKDQLHKIEEGYKDQLRQDEQELALIKESEFQVIVNRDKMEQAAKNFKLLLRKKEEELSSEVEKKLDAYRNLIERIEAEHSYKIKELQRQLDESIKDLSFEKEIHEKTKSFLDEKNEMIDKMKRDYVFLENEYKRLDRENKMNAQMLINSEQRIDQRLDDILKSYEGVLRRCLIKIGIPKDEIFELNTLSLLEKLNIES